MSNEQVAAAPLLEEEDPPGGMVKISHRHFDVQGPIDDLRIYRGALSAAQMASRMAN